MIIIRIIITSLKVNIILINLNFKIFTDTINTDGIIYKFYNIIT